MIYGISAKVKAARTNCLDRVYITYTNVENACKPVQVAFFNKEHKVVTTWISLKSLSHFEITEIPQRIRESKDTLFAFVDNQEQAEYILLDLKHYQKRKRL